MASSLISCIVPVFNGERYLGEALESIFAQTYRPLEVVVVDDGSTDGTAAVVAAHGDKVGYLFQPNAGVAAACNLGVQASRGEFIAFLAADDLWHPQKLVLQMSQFQNRPKLDLCLTHMQNFWIPELRAEEERFRNQPLAQPWPGYLPQALLARRAVFETVGLFDTTLRYEDAKDWFLRAAERGTVMELLPDVLVYRRLHRANISREKAIDSPVELLRIVKASLNRRRRPGVTSPQSLKLPGSGRGEKT
jgi:glycosyltransferase involved in cell wall biosynthesis